MSSSAALSLDRHIDPETAGILARLASRTYEEIRAETGWSRGRIYQAALRYGARKTEERIKERAKEGKQRQTEMLRELVGKTVTADVLDFLHELPDASVHAFTFSPPYNVGIAYGDGVRGDRKRHLMYVGWLTQIVSEVARCLVPNGVAFIQVGTTQDDSGQRIPLDFLLFDLLRQAGLTFQSRVMWPTAHGLTPKRRLAERYETALVFSNGPEPRFNPNAARIPQKNPGKRSFKGPNRGNLSGHPLGAWPTDIWTIPHLGHNHPEKTSHPAQFPVALVKRAILLYTLPGDLVCDPFAGSGSSQVAAYESGRAFVGADLFYADIRAKRLQEASPDIVSDLPGVTSESIAVWQAEARRRDLRSRQCVVPAQPFPDSDKHDLEQLALTFKD